MQSNQLSDQFSGRERPLAHAMSAPPAANNCSEMSSFGGALTATCLEIELVMHTKVA